MSIGDYDPRLKIVVEALFPQLDEDAQSALVWLVRDFLMSLDAIAQSMPE